MSADPPVPAALDALLREARQLKMFIDDLVDEGGEERRGPYSAEAKWDNCKRRAALLCEHIEAALRAAGPRPSNVKGDPLLGTRWRDNYRSAQRLVVVVAVRGSKISYRNEATNRLSVSNLARFQRAFTQLSPGAAGPPED